MYYVYLLRSKQNGKIYTGYTGNLKERLRKHKNDQVHTTARMGNIELIYYEAYKDKRDAIQREKYFKTTKGKRTVRIMLKYSLAPIV
ncbi:MAG: GIY-YIG nuclease family protein [Candidatus Levybacteria bacterium]|nr:GIY-YIG nuclease family protein [Candidatus Levybacteria bacterium]